jgi:hypothetical protein
MRDETLRTGAGKAVLAALFGAAVIGLAFTTVLAGPMPLPLKAELDLAETVVSGKIVDIAEKKEDGGSIGWGDATVAVSEMLKGKAVKEVKVTVAVSVADGMGMASPPRVYRKGEEGVFVIMAGGRPSHAHGFIEKAHVADVKAMLADLDSRKWSEEVGGLRVWAGLTPYDFNLKRDMLIFAVKNTFGKPVWVPQPTHSDVLLAVARDALGKEFDLLQGQSYHRKGQNVEGALLQPGETRYVHLMGDNYGALAIPATLPPGRYEVRIGLSNSLEGRNHLGLADESPADAWKGKVVSPPVAVEVPQPPAAIAPKQPARA